VGEPPDILRGLDEARFEGYEIRMGEVVLGGGALPLLRARPKGRVNAPWEVAGAWSNTYKALGTSVHGFFDNPVLVARILRALGRGRAMAAARRPEDVWDSELNRVAETIRANMDLKYVFRLMGLRRSALRCTRVGVEPVSPPRLSALANLLHPYVERGESPQHKSRIPTSHQPGSNSIIKGCEAFGLPRCGSPAPYGYCDPQQCATLRSLVLQSSSIEGVGL